MKMLVPAVDAPAAVRLPVARKTPAAGGVLTATRTGQTTMLMTRADSLHPEGHVFEAPAEATHVGFGWPDSGRTKPLNDDNQRAPVTTVFAGQRCYRW